MINPSSIGWIDKFFAEQKVQRIAIDNSEIIFFKKIRDTGLIYGYPISFENIADFDTSKWTSQEFTKVALLVSLHNVYEFETHEKRYENFIENVVFFYKKMNTNGFDLLKKVLPEAAFSYSLEKLIDGRVQTNDSLLTRNFSHILTNALLFEDVLAYQHFLQTKEIDKNYLKNLEETIVSAVSIGLSCKSQKSDYDDLLIKLFQSSVRYTKFSTVDIKNIETLRLEQITSSLEKLYIIELAVLAMWSDAKIGNFEKHFLFEIAKKMNISSEFVEESIVETNLFLNAYKDKIPYFNYSNPIKHFYDHTSESVKVLITRNKSRLLKELNNNTELVVLLTKAATKTLEDKEKKKIKKQLLEICKSIPSLAVFLFPGGSLLLPILIKFIPKMLPTVFNENMEKEE